MALRQNACVCCALFLSFTACRSAPEPVPEPRDITPPQDASHPSGAALAESSAPESHCAPDEQEYTRRAYRWCMRDGKISGAFIALHDDGSPALTGTFSSGVLDGEWTSYYPDGQPRWSAIFVDGKESGEVRGWRPDGSLHHVIAYQAGQRDGVSSYFHEGGEQAALLGFSSGKPAGEWVYMHANGQKAHAYKPQATGKAGVHKHWDEEGKSKRAVVGQLPKAQILTVVEPLGQDVVSCYEHARIFDQSSGKMVAQVVIGYGGEVSDVSIFESDFEHPFMAACTKRSAELLAFPQNPYGPRTLIRSWQLSVQ